MTIVASTEHNPEQSLRKERLIVTKTETLLDNIRSAWNVGSMFRTADGFSLQHIYLCGITPTPENEKVAKTSLGSEIYVPWTYYRNSVSIACELKEKGYFIVSVEEDKNAENLLELNRRRLVYPLLLVVGNEICGVDPEILDMSDLILGIPMAGFKRSLNVAVAFGIAVSTIQLAQNSMKSQL